jgi:hypothetical protein
LRQDIIEPTDGIPLFVEEMTKAVLEADSEGEARWTVAAVSIAPPVKSRSSRRTRICRKLKRISSVRSR